MKILLHAHTHTQHCLGDEDGILLHEMLRFVDALNNDNPVSDDLNLGELHRWYWALILIGSNFFGIPLVIYSHRHAFFLLSAATAVAVILSLLYHTCQTAHVCFGMSLPVLTLADHISAPAFMMALILFIINTKSAKQIRYEARQSAMRYAKPRTMVALQLGEAPPQQSKYELNMARFLDPLAFANSVAESAIRKKKKSQGRRVYAYDLETNLDEEQIHDIESRKTYHHVGYSHVTSNDENNAWGVYITYASLFVVILSALAHNFSLQAFVISFSFGLAAIFFKHIVVDEGMTLGFYHRVSLPDLIAGVSLLALSLVFYMLDIYVAYAITHSLWHCLSFIGSYLMVVGLSRHCEGWYSPIDFCYKKLLRCCLNHRNEEEEEEGVDDGGVTEEPRMDRLIIK